MTLTKIFGLNIPTILYIIIAFLQFACSGGKKMNLYGNIVALRDSAFSNYREQKFDSSYLKYNLLMNKKNITAQDMFYAAHSAALSGHYKKCLIIVERMFNKDKSNNTKDLASRIINPTWDYYYFLEKETKFKKVFKRIKSQKQEPSVINLSTFLNDLYKKDQNIRINYLKNPNANNRFLLEEIDSLNNKFTDSILQLYGFLSYKKLGTKAYTSQFTLFQHLNKRLFKKNFPLIEEAYKKNAILKPDYAYIFDRYLLYKYEKQKFGTQYSYDSLRQSYIFYPIVNWSKVNQLRTRMGLMSIEKYAKINKILLTDKINE